MTKQAPIHSVWNRILRLPEQLSSSKKILLPGLSLLVALVGVLVASLPPTPASPGQTADDVLSQCRSAGNKEHCIVERFETIAEHNPLRYSLDVLSHMRASGEAPDGCHFIAHVIGAAEVKKNPGRWEDVLGSVPADDCTGGFVMGVIEGHKLYNRSFTLNAETIQAMCRRMKREQTCIHTMGHLLLIDRGGNIDTAVSVCDQLMPANRHECHSGVFMENLYKRNLEAHGIARTAEWTDKDRVLYEQLCARQSETAARGCYREISHLYVFLDEGDPDTVFASCQRAPAAGNREECYLHAVGVITLTAGRHKQTRTRLCRVYDGRPDLLRKCQETASRNTEGM